MSTYKSDIVLGTGLGLAILFGIGWLVAAGFYGNTCGTCTNQDSVVGLVVAPLPTGGGGGGGGVQKRCSNGHLPVCPKGAKLLQNGSDTPICATPSAKPGDAPILTAPLCPQCADGTAPKCKAGFHLVATTKEGSGMAGFQCVHNAVPGIVMQPILPVAPTCGASSSGST